MENYIINNAKIVNEGEIIEASICIKNGLITKIEKHSIFKKVTQLLMHKAYTYCQV